MIGDADPLQALRDALAWFPADLLIVATHPAGRSNWLATNLVERASRHFAGPILHVTVGRRGAGDGARGVTLDASPGGRRRRARRRRGGGARGSRSRRARPRRRGTTHETRIADVEMISMLILASASVSKMSAATPGWLRIPAPTTETFAISGSTLKPAASTVVGELAGGSARRARRARSGSVKRDVRVPLGRDVLDDHVDVDPGVRERPEDAAGDARLVGHADGWSPSPPRCRARRRRRLPVRARLPP